MEEQEEALERQLELDGPEENLMASQYGEDEDDDDGDEVMNSFEQESKIEDELYADVM